MPRAGPAKTAQLTESVCPTCALRSSALHWCPGPCASWLPGVRQTSAKTVCAGPWHLGCCVRLTAHARWGNVLTGAARRSHLGRRATPMARALPGAARRGSAPSWCPGLTTTGTRSLRPGAVTGGPVPSSGTCALLTPSSCPPCALCPLCCQRAVRVRPLQRQGPLCRALPFYVTREVPLLVVMWCLVPFLAAEEQRSSSSAAVMEATG